MLKAPPNKDKDSNGTTLCPWCHRECVVVYVHGHGQCSLCGVNIEPCCQGTSVGIEKDK